MKNTFKVGDKVMVKPEYQSTIKQDCIGDGVITSINWPYIRFKGMQTGWWYDRFMLVDDKEYTLEELL